MLPGFVKGVTQVLCLNSFGLDKYSHSRITIQNSCVGSERPSLWKSERENAQGHRAEGTPLSEKEE